MTDILLKMSIFFVNIILPIAIGYIIINTTRITKEKLNILLFINILVVLPISCILVFWNMQFSRGMILLPILGFLTPLISGAIGYLFSKKKYSDPKKQGSYIVASMLSNRGTIGGLTMYILFGELGYAYVSLIILFSSINIFFIAFPLGNYFGNKQSNKEKVSLKSILLKKTNIPILGIIIGICLNLFGGARPEVATIVIDPLIKVMAWLSLIPIGSSIDFHGVKKNLKKTFDISLIKFIIMPLVTAAIAYPLISDVKMATSLVIINMMPVAINAVIVTKLANLNEDVSVAAFLITLTIYLFIMFPIITLLFA